MIEASELASVVASLLPEARENVVQKLREAETPYLVRTKDGLCVDLLAMSNKDPQTFRSYTMVSRAIKQPASGGLKLVNANLTLSTI